MRAQDGASPDCDKMLGLWRIFVRNLWLEFLVETCGRNNEEGVGGEVGEGEGVESHDRRQLILVGD